MALIKNIPSTAPTISPMFIDRGTPIISNTATIAAHNYAMGIGFINLGQYSKVTCSHSLSIVFYDDEGAQIGSAQSIQPAQVNVTVDLDHPDAAFIKIDTASTTGNQTYTFSN